MKFNTKVTILEYSQELEENGQEKPPVLTDDYMVQINEMHMTSPSSELPQPNYSDRMVYVINSPVALPQGKNLYVPDYEMVLSPSTTGKTRIPFNASRNHVWQGYYIEQNESMAQYGNL